MSPKLIGCGLDGLLRLRAQEGRLTEIIDGINTDSNPRLDCHFEAGDLKSRQANAEVVR